MTTPRETDVKTTKRRRRRRSELRELMLRAGTEVLLDIEPTLGFEHLTYTAVFDHLQAAHDEKVTIGSVHERIWSSQRDFQLDVIAEALRQPIPKIHDAAFTRAAALIESLDLSTPAARRYAAQSSVRHGSYHLNPDGSSPATELALIVRLRLWPLEPGHPEAEGFTEAITDIRTDSTAEYCQVIRLLMRLIGLRVRADAGDPDEVIECIAVLGNATTVGLQTDLLPASQQPRLIPSGPNGEMEAWYPDAIALWSSVRSMLELDGDDLTDEQRRL